MVAVVATCGFGTIMLVKDDNTVVGALPNATPTPPKRDITSRTADPKPMTVDDIFPTAQIIADPAVPPYQRIGKPQVSKDCRIGATSSLATLMTTYGCSQLIRASFYSPDKGHLITAGVFNLTDDAAVTKANAAIKKTLDAGKGRFTGYISTPSAKILGRAATQLAWDSRGHFLVYAVMARADGKELTSTDPHLRVMIYDIVEKYLRDQVIAEWSIDHSEGPPGATPSMTPAG